MKGHKELLGLWQTELQNRDVWHILIASVDRLKGIPDAINFVYPETWIQVCIVHMVCNSKKFVVVTSCEVNKPRPKTKRFIAESVF